MYPNYYPGNAYVNIMGLDLYDVGCLEPYTRLTFSQLATSRLGLTYFEAFAAAKHKPMSFPEWGLAALPSADDPGYITGMAKTFEAKISPLKPISIKPGRASSHCHLDLRHHFRSLRFTRVSLRRNAIAKSVLVTRTRCVRASVHPLRKRARRFDTFDCGD